ncbi:MAG: aldo/keto reductase [Oligoflexales bacterium]|nr:aldo/keto reductase [Oligoflexales bacterium]
MEYKQLGGSGLKVSRLGLGTMGFGGDADEKTSEQILSFAIEQGINIVDTANVYQSGLTEDILGRILGSRRQKVLLCSKAYFRTGDGPNDMGLSRQHVMRSVDESLKRLKTDYLDIFYAHHYDPHTDLEELAWTLDLLVKSGKVRTTGISNFSAWQGMKLLGLQHHKPLIPFRVWQPMYSLVKRQAELEILECAKSEGIGVISYGALAAGLLTGKYISQGPSISTETLGRMQSNTRYVQRYSDPQLQNSVTSYVHYCRERNWNPIHVALWWASSHEAVSSTLIGARTLKQLEEQISALQFKGNEEIRHTLCAFFGPRMSPTDRTEELV